MTTQIDIKDIEIKREGAEQMINYIIDQYEKQTQMVVEEFVFTEEGAIRIIDRLERKF